ncbi:uncharacterized protein LOC107371247 [Tetranychus urticae]|uniref:uncharacterized protein LOC107371247 n=1 Tax=Tetranychus urticae TaxID=32264 RepID=UPI00077B9200|nr:uncharacterized protein LOC107371247 [Tetranychus urticae]
MKDIENSKTSNKYVALLMLDIKGAFDNLNWTKTIEIVRKTWSPEYAKWLEDYFSQREYEVQFANSTFRFSPEKGCVQGSPLSPILWNLTMNLLLERLQAVGAKATAYADDITILIEADSHENYKKQFDKIINMAEEWSNEVELEFAKDKTELLVIKGKNIDDITIYEHLIQLKIKHQVKILGIYVDAKQLWTHQIKQAAIKALKVTQLMKAICCRGYGISKNLANLIYKMVYVPIVSYGAEIWGKALEKKHNAKILKASQKSIITNLLGAYRNNNISDLLILSNLTGIDIEIRAKYEKASLLNGKTSVIMDIKDRQMEIKTSIHLHIPPQEWPQIEIGDCKQNISKEGIQIFTDGSVSEKGVGAAWAITDGPTVIRERKLKLANQCTIYQAEGLAVKDALSNLEKYIKEIQTVNIFTDSRSIITALQNTKTDNEIICDIKILIKYLNGKGWKIIFNWIKGHANHTGNELADMLAKKAAQGHGSLQYTVIPKAYIKQRIKEWAQETSWNEHKHKTSNTLKQFVESPLPKNTVMCKQLIWLLTGKGPFNYYLHKMKIIDTPLCQCKVNEQTSIHLITRCEIFRNLRRNTLYEDYPTPTKINKMLKDSEEVEKLNRFAEKLVKELYELNRREANMSAANGG